MWIARQLFAQEWEECKVVLLRKDAVTQYACDTVSMDMDDGFPVLVGHNIRNHALLFRLINHPKDCPDNYYYIWQDAVVKFSSLGADFSLRYIEGAPEKDRQIIADDVCVAIQTLGPLLNGCPVQDQEITLHRSTRHVKL